MDIGLPVDDDISILLEGLKETLPRDKYKVVQAVTMAPRNKIAMVSMAIPAIPPSNKFLLEELEGRVMLWHASLVLETPSQTLRHFYYMLHATPLNPSA